MRANCILKALSVTLVAGTSFSPAYTRESKQPNIVIVQTDELSFRTLGAYRKTLSKEQAEMWGPGNVVKTPNIDALAANGILCTEFYTNCPQSAPSRACFLTGLYSMNNGVIVNGIDLEENRETFAHILAANGYATGYAGKWHLSNKTVLPGWAPQPDMGFEDSKYMYNNGHWKKMVDTPEGPSVAVKDEKGRPSVAVDNADKESYATDFFMTKTIDFIKKHKDGPFCFMLSIADPHGPNTVREPYASMYQDMEFQKPRTWTGSNKGKRTIDNKGLANYFGMVKCIDDNMGRLVKSLKEQGLYDNTIIIFTADHGDMLGEHDRDDKGVPYEASLKIPFIIQCPALLPQGEICKNVMSNVDVKPTLLGLVGLAGKAKSDGNDYSKILLEAATGESYSNVAFCRGPAMKKEDMRGFVCVVTDRYKLVCNPGGKISALYDRMADPDELKDFSASPDYQDVVKKLMKQLKEYGNKYGDRRMADVRK